MQINSGIGIAAAAWQGMLSRRTPAANSGATATALAEKITISQYARDLLAAQSTPTANSASGDTAEFDTNKGRLALNIDTYFAPPGDRGVDLDAVPLLMPSQKNIDALRSHLSAAMPEFLARNGIPAPPARITYDRQGLPELPADYPYAAEFRQALENEPTLARELSTVNALSSHLAGMKKSLPFMAEYASATSPAGAAAVVAKYSHLFSNHQHSATIALNFSASGALSVTADGKPIA